MEMGHLIAYRSYPGQAYCSYIPLQNIANCLLEKRNSWLGLKAGSPFFDGTVTLLVGLIFLYLNTLARTAGLTRASRDPLARAKGSAIFS